MSAYINNWFCCGYYLVPRYKRLVNNIFQQDPNHVLDNNNIEKLRFYGMVKPEKLDKLFRYMRTKIARYRRHQNRPYVILGIKAMHDTMKLCYQQLNTFVDDYLQTLQLLLEERNDFELLEHVISSFESFCKIREEAPNYQQNYEYFIHRFTELSHTDNDINMKKFRCLGLRGHSALFLKTANDELQKDVWKHMDQIVPSVLYNLQIERTNPIDDISPTTLSDENESKTNEDPCNLANAILRDLFCRAHSHSNINVCIQPILTYLDQHRKWMPCDFPKYIFSQIMMSIKPHNSYIIIDLLLSHLDKNLDFDDSESMKTSIMHVIHDCLTFAASNTAIGPTMLAGLSRLLQILERSLINSSESSIEKSKYQGEERFQNAIINGIEHFTDRLPDFQIIEILQCIVGSVPILHETNHDLQTCFNNVAQKLQSILLKTMHRIVLKNYSSRSDSSSLQKTAINRRHSQDIAFMLTTFPHLLFDPLIKLMNENESETRFIVLEVLQQLICQRQYTEKFRRIIISKDISPHDLPVETKRNCPTDIPFIKKFGHQFLSHLYKCILMENNTKHIFHAIYFLMTLVTLETNDQDVLIDMIHFCFHIQSTVVEIINGNHEKLARPSYRSIHALIAAYFNLMSRLFGISSFSQHVDEVIHNRERHARHLLPPDAFHDVTKANFNKRISKGCLFNQETVINAFRKHNYDIARFRRSFHLQSDSDSTGADDDARSESNESLSSGIDLRITDENENISFEAIQNVLSNPLASARDRADENARLKKEFRTKPLRELEKLVIGKKKQSERQFDQIRDVHHLPKDHLSKSSTTTPLNNYPDLFTY